MDGAHSTDVQQAEVQRVKELIVAAMDGELQQIAELFVGTPDGQLFGKTEFALRNLVLAAGCRAMEAVLEDRKKGGTKAAAPRARPARATADSSTGGRGK